MYDNFPGIFLDSIEISSEDGLILARISISILYIIYLISILLSFMGIYSRNKFIILIQYFIKVMKIGIFIYHKIITQFIDRDLIKEILYKYYFIRKKMLGKEFSYYDRISNWFNAFETNGPIGMLLFMIDILKGYWFIFASDVHIYGNCTFNNVDDMFNYLFVLNFAKKLKYKWDDFVKTKKFDGTKYESSYKEIINNWDEDKYKRVSIDYLPYNANRCNYIMEKDREYLTPLYKQVNGYNIFRNIPFKLHKCSRNEIESVYRQIKTVIRYDDKVAREFIRFAHREIDKMIYEFVANHKDFKHMTLEEYYKKLGNKRREYQQGYARYLLDGAVRLIFKGHSKIDEKIIIDFNEVKGKSRSICAQTPIGKILLGIPCELAQQVLHEYDWYGSGVSLGDKSKKFSKWVQQIPNCACICADGSAFDSTQHQLFIEQIDGYFLNKILNFNPYLSQYFDLSDIRKVIRISKHKIYMRYNINFTIAGTQLSGKMNTSLCNSLRSALYVKFILYKGRFRMDDIKFEVTGDDQIIFLNYCLVNKYIKLARIYVYADDDLKGAHGLGQIAKIFLIFKNITGAEYLSNYILYDDESKEIALIRKPERFFQSIPFTFRNSCSGNKYLKLKYSLAYQIAESAYMNFQNIDLYKTYLLCMMRYSHQELDKLPRLCWKKNAQIRKTLELNKTKERYKINDTIDVKFNRVFNNFLYEKFSITEEDIKEFNKMILLNWNNSEPLYDILIDKFYPKIKSPDEFSNIMLKTIYKNHIYLDEGYGPRLCSMM
jgi:hypothetical protein